MNGKDLDGYQILRSEYHTCHDFLLRNNPDLYISVIEKFIVNLGLLVLVDVLEKRRIDLKLAGLDE